MKKGNGGSGCLWALLGIIFFPFMVLNELLKITK
jgi:hypothetical protein